MTLVSYIPDTPDGGFPDLPKGVHYVDGQNFTLNPKGKYSFERDMHVNICSFKRHGFDRVWNIFDSSDLLWKEL